MASSPVTRAELPGAVRALRSLKFKPVPVRSRHDGWTAEKQIAFIEALAETACAEEACRRVRAPSSAASNFTRNDAAPRELSEVKHERPSTAQPCRRERERRLTTREAVSIDVTGNQR